MKTRIKYKNRTPELSEGFYHKDCPVLFANHDEITSLELCPFPLKTPTFKVLLFGKSKLPDKPNDTFAVVRHTKDCGHEVEERIAFQEGVKDFDHYGTKFFGADYSIASWEKRIECFRNYPCDICSLIRHALWVYSIGEGPRSRKQALARLRYLLDYNYANWSEFASWSDIEERMGKTVRR